MMTPALAYFAFGAHRTKESILKDRETQKYQGCPSCKLILDSYKPRIVDASDNNGNYLGKVFVRARFFKSN